VDFGRDEGRVLGVCVWMARYMQCGSPRYHPRVLVSLLVLVVVGNVGSLISAVQRSPAGMGVVSRDGQAGGVGKKGALEWGGRHGRVQEGSRHPRVPGRTPGAAWGSPRILIEDLRATDGRVGSGWIGETDGGYVR